MSNLNCLKRQITLLGLLIIVICHMFALTSCSWMGFNNDTTVEIYFSKMAGNKIVTEPVKRKVKKGKNKVAYVVEQLLKGPNDDEIDLGFYSEIPQTTKLISVIDDPIQVRVNLSKDFVSGGGSNSTIMRLKELTETLLSAEKQRPVYIDVEGDQLELLGGEGQEVPEPLTKDLNAEKP